MAFISNSIDKTEKALAAYLDAKISACLNGRRVLTATDILDLKNYQRSGDLPSVFVFVRLFGGTRNTANPTEKNRQLTVTVYVPSPIRAEVFEAISDLPDDIYSRIFRQDQLILDGGNYLFSRIDLSDFVADSPTFYLDGERYGSLTATGSVDIKPTAVGLTQSPACLLVFPGYESTPYRFTPTAFSASVEQQSAPESIDGKPLIKQLLTGSTVTVEADQLCGTASDPGFEPVAAALLNPIAQTVTATVDGVTFPALLTVRKNWSGYSYQMLHFTLVRID